MLRRSSVVLLVCRPRLDEVGLVAERAAELLDAGCVVEIVTIGDRPYHPVEVAERCGVPPLGVVADDRSTALRFDAAGPACQLLSRSQLGRSTKELASAVAARATRMVEGPTPLSALVGR